MQSTRPPFTGVGHFPGRWIRTSIVIFRDVRRGKTYAIKNTRESCKQEDLKARRSLSYTRLSCFIHPACLNNGSPEFNLFGRCAEKHTVIVAPSSMPIDSKASPLTNFSHIWPIGKLIRNHPRRFTWEHGAPSESRRLKTGFSSLSDRVISLVRPPPPPPSLSLSLTLFPPHTVEGESRPTTLYATVHALKYAASFWNFHRTEEESSIDRRVLEEIWEKEKETKVKLFESSQLPSFHHRAKIQFSRLRGEVRCFQWIVFAPQIL